MVIGASGSGKSTVAAQLAERLDATLIELDQLFHRPNWEPTPTPEFRMNVMEAIAAADGNADRNGWVVAGNYPVVSDLTHGSADTIVWLDLPRRRTVARVVRRSVGRVASRRELWNGNRETLRDVLSRDPERSIVAHAWRSHPRVRERYAGFLGTAFWEHADVRRLTSQSEVRALVASARPTHDDDRRPPR